MGNIKSTFLITVLLGVVACAGMQATEETLNSVELKGHQISVGMPSGKVRELAGEPDSIVTGRHYDPSNQTSMTFGGKGNVDTSSFTWWRYYGKGQDVNLKIDEAAIVKEIIVSRYPK